MILFALKMLCAIIAILFLTYCAGRMFGLGMGKSLLNIKRKECVTRSAAP